MSNAFLELHQELITQLKEMVVDLVRRSTDKEDIIHVLRF